jgi:eukaryotic-like serine/threonine-protein kinase
MSMERTTTHCHGDKPDHTGLRAHPPHPAGAMAASLADRDGFERYAVSLGRHSTADDPVTPFDLVEEIGRGGMGIILRGRDRILDRDLAIKVLLERFRDCPDLIRRFIEEARITGRLQHPFIVPVHHFGTLPDGRPYFAMKLIDGRTLADLLAERPDPSCDLPRYLQVFEQVCQTLAYAHSRGVIHRDLKPANVMVGAFGEVQVMDWGLAKQLPEGPSGSAERTEADPETVNLLSDAPAAVGQPPATEAGSLLGTMAFVPPEQASGDVAGIDRRSDVFGLGAILCSILTGQPPYVGSRTEIFQKAQDGRTGEALERLHACGADSALIQLACACLARDAWRRPVDGTAVADAMAAYFAAAQQRLRLAEIARARAETEAAEESKRAKLAEAKVFAEQMRALAEQRRRRVTLLLAASLLLFVCCGAFCASWYQRQRAQQRAAVASRRAATGRDVTVALAEARALHEQGLKLCDNPDRWQATLQAAWSAWKYADEAFAHGEPTDSLRQQVAAVRLELERDERDCQFLADLERVQQDWGLSKDQDSGNRLALRRYQEVFAAYGLDLAKQGPAEIGARLHSHRFRSHLVESIEAWSRCQAAFAGTTEFVLNPKQDGFLIVFNPDWKKAERFLRVLEAVETEPNSFRGRWRQARARRDGAELARLAETPEALSLPPMGLCNLAQDLRSALQMNAALGLLRKGLGKNPDDFWLNFLMGDTLLYADPPAPDAALLYLTAARALRSKAPFVYLELSQVLRKTGDKNGALREARAAIEVDRSFAPSHYDLGLLLWEMGEYDQSIQCMLTALTLDKDSPILRAGLGNNYLQKGEVDQALHYLREAVQIDPRSFSLQTSLGNALLEKGEIEAAMACYRAALALEPKFPLARMGLGTARVKKKDLEGALAEFQQAIDQVPKLLPAYYMKAEVYLMRGDPMTAVSCYRRPVDLDPQSVAARLNLSSFLLKLGDLAGAKEHAQKALDLDAKSIEAHVSLMLVVLKMGKVNEALRRGQEAEKLFPDAPEVQDALGTILYWSCELEKAVQSHRRALERNPSRGVYYENLGLALRARGELEAAVDAFRSAIRFTVKKGEGRYLLAGTLYGMGRLEEALEVSRKDVERNPNNPLSHILLAAILSEKGNFAAAKEAIRLGQAKLSALDFRQQHFVQILGRCEQLEKSRQKLTAILAGKEKPANEAEQLTLGMVCALSDRKAHAAAAARLFKEAFAAQPRFAENPDAGCRYKAACCAILAGTGQSDDGQELDAAAKVELRRQARDWLRADLVGMEMNIASRNPLAFTPVQYRLWVWHNDPDLAAVRDSRKLTALPAQEREEWLALWNEVATMCQKASP